jgi:hypothetical protein
METRSQWLRRQITALRGTRKQAVLNVLWLRPLRLTSLRELASTATLCWLSCFLRAVRLVLYPARSLLQRFLMRLRPFFKVCLAAVMVGCVSAHAIEDLNGLYQLAVNHNADYRAALANTEAEREELTKAKALFYPKVQLGLMRGHGETDRTTHTTIGSITTSLN